MGPNIYELMMIVSHAVPSDSELHHVNGAEDTASADDCEAKT